MSSVLCEERKDEEDAAFEDLLKTVGSSLNVSGNSGMDFLDPDGFVVDEAFVARNTFVPWLAELDITLVFFAPV